MFRELTLDELDFVSGGKPDKPPEEPPLPPQIDITTEGDTITVTASSGGGSEGWTGSIAWDLPSWDLSTLTIGYTEGGETGSITWDAGEGTIGGSFTHDFGNGVSVTATVTAGDEGTAGLLELDWRF